MYQRILVPLDGSETAERAVPYAGYLARGLNSEIILFTALERDDRAERPFRAYLNQKVAELGDEWVRASMAIDHDNAAQAILRFADKTEIELIVICTHGSTGPGIWSMGSVAAKLMQQSRAPILLIRSSGPAGEAEAEKAFHNILLPLDGSQLAEQVIPHIERLATALNSRVFPIKVVDPLRFPPVPIANYAAGMALKEYERDLAEMMTKEAAQYLEEKESELQGRGVNASALVLTGRPDETINRYARDNGMGLIALTTHGLTGSHMVPYGSLTSKILETSSSPVFLVRSSLVADPRSDPALAMRSRKSG